MADAQLAYISQLGSSFNHDELEFDVDKMSKKFKLSALQRGGARFDFEKAKSINQKILSKKESSLLISEHPKVFERLIKATGDNAFKVVDLIKTRVSLLTDFQKELNPFVQDPNEYDMGAIKNILKSVGLDDLNIIGENIKLSKANSIKESIYKDSQRKGVNFGKLMQFLRISLVGDLSGPDVFFIIKIIGKDVTLKRFNSLLEKIQKQ